MISVDKLVLEMRDILELSYIFNFEKDEVLSKIVYGFLKRRIQLFYRDCYLADKDVLKESLFYAKSLIKAYQGDEPLEKMATSLKEYIDITKKDLYSGKTKNLGKK